MAANRNDPRKETLSTDPVNSYRRKYLKQHPETAMKWRISAAKNLLTKHGYLIEAPTQEGGASK